MVAGAGPDRGFGVALFVGYHARAGNLLGTIAHTYSFQVVRSTLNGRPAGEAAINAIALGAWGVPVGMIAGDDVLAAEMADWFPWAERVVVKEAFGRHAAASVHPSVAGERVRAGAERAVRRAIAGEMRPLVLDPPTTVEITYQNALQADYACIVPGAERVGETGARFSSDDPRDRPIAGSWPECGWPGWSATDASGGHCRLTGWPQRMIQATGPLGERVPARAAVSARRR